MKILVVGPFGQGLLAESYANAFVKNGHEVLRFDSDRAYFQSGLFSGNRWMRRLLRRFYWERVNLSTIEVIRCTRPSFVFALKTSYLNPEIIWRIRNEENTPVFNYYPDDPYIGVPLDPRKASAQRRDLLKALREYNKVFVWEKGLVDTLHSDGVVACYLPFGVDPDSYKPVDNGLCRECGQEHRVVFVGQHNKRRETHIEKVEDHIVSLWGNGWHRARRRLSDKHFIHKNEVVGQTCAALYTTALVSLNIVNHWNLPGHNMRTFEIPACGGVMVSTFSEEQANFFPESEAAWYYRDPRELDDIIERLLTDSDARERTRRNALKLATGHDYRARAVEVVNEYLKLV